MSDDRLCVCGHTAHWHAPDGSCEHDGDCACREFRAEPAPIMSVDVPPGTRFYQLSAFAESQEAYDALSKQDGWAETIRYERTGARTGWKSRPLGDRGGNITVFAPERRS